MFGGVGVCRASSVKVALYPLPTLYRTSMNLLLAICLRSFIPLASTDLKRRMRISPSARCAAFVDGSEFGTIISSI